MIRYTIKKGLNEQIYLLDEQGQRQSTTEVLRQVAPSRVLALDAKMGAGKTTFVKQLCEDMGTEDVVNSPTFAIVNVYEVRKEGEKHGVEEVYHFDCYRMKDIREALDMGAEEYLYSGNLCLIEWPEVLTPILPENTVWLHIQVEDNGDRTLTIDR